MTYPKYKNKHLEEALFNAHDSGTVLKHKNMKLPKKYIFLYHHSVKNYLKRKYKPKKIVLSPIMIIYVWKDIGFVDMKGIGSPYAAGAIENLIALGGKKFLNVGVAGGLHSWGFYLCTKALRDEGTSYHYLPHGKYVYPDKILTNNFGKTMDKAGISYLRAPTWTTDAFYRETKAEIVHYSKIGIKTVEMEAAALFSIAQVRKVKIASAFVVSDILGEKWENKFGKWDLHHALNQLFDAAVECLKEVK
ncbi:MAG: nucleoside phosphorylase [Candidatus Pacearchaeota archaeon]|jgi:uridine phosphorylase